MQKHVYGYSCRLYLSIGRSLRRDYAVVNPRNKAGILYNKGWALVHMLALNQEYRPN